MTRLLDDALWISAMLVFSLSKLLLPPIIDVLSVLNRGLLALGVKL